MRVYLEKFSILRAPGQGQSLSQLVAAEADNLRDTFPGTVAGYGSPLKSISRVAKIASNHGHREGIDAYVIREGKMVKTAIGIATVISGDVIVHPQVGEIAGKDLDYWLVDRASDSVHRQAASLLIAETKRIPKNEFEMTLEDGAERTVEFNSHDYTFTVLTDAINPLNRGLIEFGEPIGIPGPVESLRQGDPYGLARDGLSVQVYQGTTMQRPFA